MDKPDRTDVIERLNRILKPPANPPAARRLTLRLPIASPRHAIAPAIMIVGLTFAGWFNFAGRPANWAATGMNGTATGVNGTERQVAEDAVRRYLMMSHHGAALDRCSEAATVAAAYSQAKDEVQYQAWKRTEAADCALAGMRP